MSTNIAITGIPTTPGPDGELIRHLCLLVFHAVFHPGSVPLL